MSAALILMILKYVGIGVAAVSTLWGLSQKTTFDDDHGRKRLTAAGQVAVALILCSSLIAASSFGFETLVKQDEQRQKEAAATAARSEAIRKDAVALQRETQRRAEAAELRAVAADQRALTLLNASEERERDLMLSKSVSLGAERNLRKAENALSELQRVLQPIKTLDVWIAWTVPGGAPVVQQGGARLVELGQQVRTSPRTFPQGVNGGSTGPDGRISSLNVDAESPHYPPPGNTIRQLVETPHQVSIFASRKAAESALVHFQQAQRSFPGIGDVIFWVGEANAPDISYSVDSGDVLFTARRAVDFLGAQRTSAIASVPDLESSAWVIVGDGSIGSMSGEAMRPLRRPFYPVSAEVTVGSRRYRFRRSDFREIATPMGPVFVLEFAKAERQ